MTDLRPMLAKTGDPAEHPRWPFELKLDGYRAVFEKSGTEVRGWTRTGGRIEGKVPHLTAAMRALPFDFVLDGELVWSTGDGEVGGLPVPRPSEFGKVAEVMQSLDAEAVRKQRSRSLRYVAFDVLDLMGKPLMSTPDALRRRALEGVRDALTEFTSLVSVVPRWPRWDPEVFAALMDEGHEGIILKNPMGVYRPGHRSGDWLKVKRSMTSDVVVKGFKPGKGRFAGQVGAMRFGQYRDGRLIERGACSGMDDAMRLWITERQPALMKAVIEVEHNGTVGSDRTRFRHPRFVRFRDDKTPAECVWEPV